MYPIPPGSKGNISVSFSRPIGPGSKDKFRSPGSVTAKACDGLSSGAANGVAEGSVDEPASPSPSDKPQVSDCGPTWLFKASEIARQVPSNPAAALSFLVAESHTLTSI